ncbi:MAG: hypothetical protein QXV93_00035 [Zestosphaera sp.]
MAGSRVLDALLGVAFFTSLITSLYLSNYLLVSVVGLATYTYMVLAGRSVPALTVLLASLPFQVLVVGPHAIHVIAYYSVVLVVRSLIFLRRSYLIFAPVLVPAVVYLTLFHPFVDVPPLHYLLVCCVALVAGYFLRVAEELISFGVTCLEVPELDLTRLLDVKRILGVLVLAYVVPVFSASLFFVLLSYGIALTHSLLASLSAGFLLATSWFLIRVWVLRLALVLVLTTLSVLAGGSWLLSIFDESLRFFEEVLRYFG